MHPYRDPPATAPTAARGIPREETLLAMLVLIVAAVRLVAMVVTGGPFDGGGTIALFAAVASAWWLVSRARPARRLP